MLSSSRQIVQAEMKNKERRLPRGRSQLWEEFYSKRCKDQIQIQLVLGCQCESVQGDTQYQEGGSGNDMWARFEFFGVGEW